MVATEDTFVRGDFAETMKFSRVPDSSSNSGVKRFMSHTPAWKPAAELPWAKANLKYGTSTDFAPAAYGGHVYAQAPYVAAKAIAEEDEAGNGAGKFGIHSIQGVFTKGGATDRPFVYDVTQVHSGRTFATKFIQARQPIEASSQPSGPYPLTDADRPLGDVRFACLTTFKRPMASPAERQMKSAQERYADILSQRAPDEWEASPQMDVEAVTDLFPNAGHGGFPMLDMYKVDMTAYNADKDTPERRELLLYRPHKPIAEDDPDAHIVTHAFEADRNGLLMLTNHLGWGYSLGSVASLSYAFYVHVNAEEAVMKGDGWWIQEACWPRASAGRGLLESRIWSPEGKHVASGYQDGLALPSKKGLWWKKKKAGEKL